VAHLSEGVFSRGHQVDYRFIADRMLGRLAKMLRLLGYDTLFARDLSALQLKDLARREGRIILTRGDVRRRFYESEDVLRLRSEYAPEQLREVVEHFGLDVRSGLWTRCTLCNAAITRVEKMHIQPFVKPRVYELYEDFYQCIGCRHVYWRGSHVERILKNLSAILERF
jgi:uncharacterized protein with PIN domain